MNDDNTQKPLNFPKSTRVRQFTNQHNLIEYHAIGKTVTKQLNDEDSTADIPNMKPFSHTSR